MTDDSTQHNIHSDSEEFFKRAEEFLDHFRLSGAAMIVWDDDADTGLRHVAIGKTVADRKLANVLVRSLKATVGVPTA